MSGRPPPNISGMTSLKIDNLSYRTDSESLRRKFSKYGEIGDVYIPKDKYGESRGFAFVRFHDKRDAGDAIDQLDGRDIDGREIRVDYARHERPSFDKWRGSRRDRSRSRSRDEARLEAALDPAPEAALTEGIPAADRDPPPEIETDDPDRDPPEEIDLVLDPALPDALDLALARDRAFLPQLEKILPT
ncbi:Oidioi.mRNA.OKI2018_I69.chr1.g2968.t2.cds [Oikopleura dioica]|uniref:Oidioi.mRNA.OKI2018_I69.chr1.g2968.t2.cds n=1 Tax=Oikopleura dioica TaxID=34765 RepID=A0ABN7SY57_OIKDI|nr:Oidioi.mRNA.OKI2018_I69.chr1.g2968.t2.cds [Oikopleura dioica]